MKLVLVDDSKAVQRSFGGLLESVPEVELVGVAEDVAGAKALIDATEPDFVVLDLELGGGDNGIDVLKHVVRHRPQMQVIVLSNFDGQKLRDDLLAAGALAYFDKSSEFLLARDWIASRAAAATATKGDRRRP